MKDYTLFVSNPALVPEGKSVDLHVIDNEMYRGRAVEAVISKKDMKDSTEWNRLIIRSPLSIVKNKDNPWFIKILKEYEDEKLMDTNICLCDEE
ncbi:MAG: hypothetical protein SV062_07200 [Thermodesulfobacteriota bacterium]|nr:hypothetical protein [Thermodesulfobacteriota bacterium]